MKKVVIIGNGIAGITAARHIRKMSDKSILVISDESKYFFSRTALMYVYMGHMRWNDIEPYEPWFWEKNRIDLLFDKVTSVDTEKKLLTLQSGKSVSYDQLILALGSKPAFYNWPGQNSLGVQGLYSKQDLENLENATAKIKCAVIVGGGLIGVELAEMLLSRNIKVTFLVREKSFWNNVLPDQDSMFVTSHLKKHPIDFKFETTLKEIIPDNNNQVKSIITSNDQEINCEFVGITTGVTPNIELVKNLATIKTEKGIIIDQYFQTSAPDVYAIGDCTQFENPLVGRKSIEQVWYTGRIMGETLAANICDKKMAYNPGPWFNSAKFFDLEYQTYGDVPSVLPIDKQNFFWKHDTDEKAIHFVWKKDNLEFVGVNTFGIRMRHEILDHWLKKKSTIIDVISNLGAVNFDAELSKKYESEIIASFVPETGIKIELKPKKWWQNLLEKK